MFKITNNLTGESYEVDNPLGAKSEAEITAGIAAFSKGEKVTVGNFTAEPVIPKV